MSASMAAVIIAKEKHIVEAFRRTGATSPAAAVSPASIGVAEGVAFRRLHYRALLRPGGAGAGFSTIALAREAVHVVTIEINPFGSA